MRRRQGGRATREALPSKSTVAAPSRPGIRVPEQAAAGFTYAGP
jgi:hypothetical protein